MKQRTLALLAAAALALSLLGVTVLAAEEDPSEPDVPALQAEESQTQPEEEPSAEPEEAETEGPKEGEEGASEEPPAEEYIPDPVGSISFANVNRRMHEGNLQVLALQESIDMLEEIDYDKLKEDMRLQLNEIAKAQWSMVMMSGYMSDYEYHSAYDQMDQAYDAVRKQFDAIKEGDMQEDNADTVRQLTALDRQLTELDLRYELGHISSLTLKQAQAGRSALDSGLSTLRMNLNTYKGQLELLLGADITGTIALGPLPKVTQADLDRMDLEQDLETAKENSWDLYQATETYKDARKEYNDHGGDFAQTYNGEKRSYQQARHTYYTAKYTYDNTVQSFELNLRNLYLKVQDYRQILDAYKTALAVEQDNYAVSQLKYSQGNLSQNSLLEAEDKLKEAQEKVAGAENDLLSAYNTYRWAVDYGIMN